MSTDENESPAGKVAFVTGAASGIGRAALAFARKGASVVVADISEQDNQDTARKIEELSGRASVDILLPLVSVEHFCPRCLWRQASIGERGDVHAP